MTVSCHCGEKTGEQNISVQFLTPNVWESCIGALSVKRLSHLHRLKRAR